MIVEQIELDCILLLLQFVTQGSLGTVFEV